MRIALTAVLSALARSRPPSRALSYLYRDGSYLSYLYHDGSYLSYLYYDRSYLSYVCYDCSYVCYGSYAVRVGTNIVATLKVRRRLPLPDSSSRAAPRPCGWVECSESRAARCRRQRY